VQTIEGFFRPKFTNYPFNAISVGPSFMMGGKVYTSIADHPARINFPRRQEARNGHVLLSPEWVHASTGYLWPRGTEIEDESNGWGNPHLDQVRMFGITVRLDDSEDPEAVATTLQEELPRWWARVEEWFQLLSGNELDSRDRAVGPNPNPTLWTKIDGEMRYYHQTGIWTEAPLVLKMQPDIQRPLIVSIIKSGKGLDVPVDWSLLRQAVSAWNRHDHRSCVLDAATALDIALSGLLRTSLAASNSQALIDEYLDRKTLGALVQSYERHAGKLPNGRQVTIRNDVAHHGYQPTQAEAGSVLEMAIYFVNLATPSSAFFEEDDALEPRNGRDLF
jgi:hypothetical protein